MSMRDSAPLHDYYINTRPYWDGLREHRLVLQQCQDTGRLQHYPRPVSIFTGSRNLAWQEVSGNGTLAAWTAVSNTPSAIVTPSTQILVELDEGVRLLALLLDQRDGALCIGQRLKLTWLNGDRSTTGPIFVRA